MSTMERNAIGSALIRADAVDEICLLDIDDFADKKHQAMFKAIKALHAEGKAVDLVTVSQSLSPLDGIADGMIVEIVTNTVTPSNYQAYVKGVQEESAKRKLRIIGATLASESSERFSDVWELVDKANTSLANIGGKTTSAITQKEAWLMFCDRLSEAGQTHHKRVYTGIPALDDYTGGIWGSKLIVVGARPGNGKSAFALITAITTASKGHDVLFVSLEMDAPEIISRTVANHSGVDGMVLEKGCLNEREYGLAMDVGSRICNYPITYDETADTPAKIRRLVAQMPNKNNLGLIIVDYLQLMRSGEDNGNRPEEVAQISRALKKMAKQLKIPIMALAQLNRESEKKLTRKPSKSELRESGAIEQDADMIFLLWPPENEEGLSKNQKDAFLRCKDKGYDFNMVIIDKYRGGKKMTFGTAFDGAHMRFLKVPEGIAWQVTSEPSPF